MTLDAHQLASGERPGDHATAREVRDYWIDRAFASINAVRLADGRPPVMRASRPAHQTMASVTIESGPSSWLVVREVKPDVRSALLVDERTLLRWRAAHDAFVRAQSEMSDLLRQHFTHGPARAGYADPAAPDAVAPTTKEN